MAPKRLIAVRFRRVGNRSFLVKGSLAFELDQVGQQIWELCDGERTFEAIVDSLAGKYPDVDRQTLTTDCQEFISELSQNELIQV